MKLQSCHKKKLEKACLYSPIMGSISPIYITWQASVPHPKLNYKGQGTACNPPTDLADKSVLTVFTSRSWYRELHNIFLLIKADLHSSDAIFPTKIKWLKLNKNIPLNDLSDCKWSFQYNKVSYLNQLISPLVKSQSVRSVKEGQGELSCSGHLIDL